MYDYLVVGCGLFGATFARQATDRGKKCLVIDKRDHIGGNCFTNKKLGIDVHVYGPHIFHTNSQSIWDYINQFTDFNNFTYRPKVNYKNQIYSFPINLMTLYQVCGVSTPSEAKAYLDSVKIHNESPKNLEEWILSQVGKEIYEKFIYGYTYKQWNTDPKNLPASIIKRLPIRLTYDDNYFNDKYQGIPTEGYTQIFKNMLEGIPVELGKNYLTNRDSYDKMAKRVVYTGAIDEFFEYEYGELGCRSLRFEHGERKNLDLQGVAAVNYTDVDIPYTRIVEHKHFNNVGQKDTIFTKEYPQTWTTGKERFYPINNKKNQDKFYKYKKLIQDKYIFGGRLAEYKYYDMHQVIASAINTAKKELQNG